VTLAITPISEPVITQEHKIGIMLPIKKHVAWLKEMHLEWWKVIGGS